METKEPAIKWVNRFTPIWKDLKLPLKKICDLPLGTVVSTTGSVDLLYEEITVYVNKQLVRGWVHEDDIELYVRNFAQNVVQIDNQTPETNDFEQYMIHKSIKQVNMCGELCVAQILGISLNELLTKWEQTTPPLYKRIFGAGRARGTGAEELKEIFASFGRVSMPLSLALYQQHISRARYTISSVQKHLARGSIIASVHIDGTTGLIRGSGILHWISLRNVIAERNGQGMVTYYNPAMNCDETSSWAEFIASAQQPYGIFVPNLSD